MLYEFLVVFSLFIVAFLIPQSVVLAAGLRLHGTILVLHVLLLFLTYFVWFWLHGGQTLAMKTWKLRVLSANNTQIRPFQAVLRYFAAWLSFSVLGMGFLWAIFDPERQYLHDRIAGTRIVNA